MSDQRTPQDHAELFSRYSWVRKRHRLDERRRRFMRVPWAGGAVLMLCVAAAMLLANLPSTAMYYEHVLSTDLSLLIESPDHVVDLVFPRDMNVEKLINDGLMVIFFFVVGLEIKREIVCGELSTARKAILPVMAAAGGMLAPALIYLAFNHGTPAAHGWGIPTATDIAFAIGILSLMGDRVPVSLKIFLTALAVVDDLGAILVIAIFYGGAVKWGFLFLALAIMAGLYGLNRLGETRISYFLIPAFVVWGLFYYSGIHATLSGVAMAMIIPMRPRYSKPYFFRQLRNFTRSLERVREEDERFPDAEQRYYLQRMKDLSYNSIGMSYRLEDLLAPYVTFIIMPIFALANARAEPSAWAFSWDCSWASRLESSSRAGRPSSRGLPRCRAAFRGGCCWPWPAWAVSVSRCRSSSMRWLSTRSSSSIRARSPFCWDRSPRPCSGRC